MYQFKLITTLILCLILSVNVLAQTKENLDDITFNTIDSKHSFEPVEGTFPENATFRYYNNIQTDYLPSQQLQQTLNPNFYQFKAKYKDDENANYTFQIVYKYLSFVPDKIVSEKVADPSTANATVPTQMTIYKRYFKVYYHGELLISKREDNSNKLIRQVIFNNGTKSQTILVEKSLLNDNPNDYFTTEKEIELLSKSQLEPKFEKLMLTECGSKAYKVLDALFKKVSYRESENFGAIKKRKRKYDYNDFDGAFETYKLAMKSYKANDMIQGDSLLKSATSVYEKALASNDVRVNKAVKIVLNMNLAWCYYWQKDYKKSETLVNEARQMIDSLGFDTYHTQGISYRLEEVKIREEMKKGSNTDFTERWYN
jgi:hypothetical protein